MKGDGEKTAQDFSPDETVLRFEIEVPVVFGVTDDIGEIKSKLNGLGDIKDELAKKFENMLQEKSWQAHLQRYPLDELFINALYHGVLGLDSPEEDLQIYETAPPQILQSLKQKGRINGKVKVSFCVSEKDASVEIENSGRGFDAKSLKNPTTKENILKRHGRGTHLKDLVSSMKYSEGGKKAVITFKKGQLE